MNSTEPPNIVQAGNISYLYPKRNCNIFDLLNMFSRDADLLAALASSKRLEIVHLLAGRKLRVTEIYEMLDLPQANSSQHLKILREVGIIAVEKVGRERYYGLRDGRVQQLVELARFISTGEKEQAGAIAKLVPLATDPVCGMRISVPLSSFHANHGEKTYHFCASGCLKKFEVAPDRYL